MYSGNNTAFAKDVFFFVAQRPLGLNKNFILVNLATAKNVDFFETRFFGIKKKEMIFQPPNDPHGKIEISKTLLRIYRTPQNIFQTMICLLLKMYNEFEEEDSL